VNFFREECPVLCAIYLRRAGQGFAETAWLVWQTASQLSYDLLTLVVTLWYRLLSCLGKPDIEPFICGTRADADYERAIQVRMLAPCFSSHTSHLLTQSSRSLMRHAVLQSLLAANFTVVAEDIPPIQSLDTTPEAAPSDFWFYRNTPAATVAGTETPVSRSIRCHVHTSLSPPQLASVFACSTLAVHPPTYDAYGMTIIEAGAFGCPSVVHPVGIGKYDGET